MQRGAAVAVLTVSTQTMISAVARDAKVAVIVLSGLLLLAWADFITGTEIRIHPLYFIPLGFGAVRMSMPGTLASAASATLIWALANRSAGLTYTHASTWFINTMSQLVAFVVFVMLVHRLRELRDSEHRLARTDPLTGLANTRGFRERAGLEIARQQRYSHALSVAYFDLDDFKRINDTLGHARADELLRELAVALRAATRATDVVGRLGGDEFAILYPETGEQELTAALSRVQCAALEQLEGAGTKISFSIGGVTFEEPPADVDTMIAAADALMYQVKAAGKNSMLTRTQARGHAAALERSTPGSGSGPPSSARTISTIAPGTR